MFVRWFFSSFWKKWVKEEISTVKYQPIDFEEVLWRVFNYFSSSDSVEPLGEDLRYCTFVRNKEIELIEVIRISSLAKESLDPQLSQKNQVLPFTNCRYSNFAHFFHYNRIQIKNSKQNRFMQLFLSLSSQRENVWCAKQ